MTDQVEKKHKDRSPNYPALTLEKALSLIKALYDKNGKTPVAFEAAAKALDYSAKSSAGKQAMATLSYYGLIMIEGKADERRVKISESAFKIIIDTRPISPERDSLIKEAAMNPQIFKKIFDLYQGKLPDDSALEHDLKTKFEFNPKTIKYFIGILRKNIDFAKLYKNDIMPDENEQPQEAGMIEETDKIGEKRMPQVPPPKSYERQKADYSLGGDLKVRIVFSGSSAISDKAIAKLMKLLEINKEDFIEERPDDKEPH